MPHRHPSLTLGALAASAVLALSTSLDAQNASNPFVLHNGIDVSAPVP